ncbi:MAG: hypothetical protein JXX14_11755 [Deltaproteobacteria bacterium]|nr:hypothetical protein [Deltaproteobacteria bacterium]
MAVKLPAWLFCAVLTAVALPVAGQQKPQVSIEYHVDGLSDVRPLECPSLAAVRHAVESRIGYSPWDDAAHRHLDVRVNPTGNVIAVQIIMKDRSGAIIGEREVVSHGSCKEAMDAASLTLAIAIAPAEALKSAETEASAESAQAPEENASPKKSTAESAPMTAAPSPRLSRNAAAPANNFESRSAEVPAPPVAAIYLGGLGTVGALPGIGGGVDAGMGLRWRLARFHLGVRYDFPRELTPSPGRIETRQWLAETGVCIGGRWGFGCSGASLGRFSADASGLPLAGKSAGAAGFAFVRVGMERPVRSRFILQLYADLSIPIFRQKLLERGSDRLYWQTPPLGGSAGVALIFNFFQ